MVAKMADGKETEPTVVITQMEPESSSRRLAEWKSRVTKKHVIIAVTSVAVIALVLIGILVGVKFFLDSTHDIVKHTYKFKNDKEDVSTDLTDNTVEYHLKNKDNEMWVVNDFNRDLQTVKVRTSDGSVCYVTPLNQSDNASPEMMRNASAPSDGKMETENGNYILADSPLKDHSIMGSRGQKLCQNLDVYWMTPSCEEPDQDQKSSSTTEVGREKRGLCRYRCYYRYYYRIRCYYYFGRYTCRWYYIRLRYCRYYC